MDRKQRLMRLIKLAHGLVENADIEKHRQSQDQIGELVGRAKDLSFEEFDIDGIHCELVKLNKAHVHKQVILHCHGGGYSTGSSLYARTLTAKLAECTSMEVVSFDYRLAPEHPAPAALEDALKVWDHLMLKGYAARDVIVTGDSAGGNLALTLTLKLKEQGRMLPRGLVLMSPWTDLTSSGESFQEQAELDPVLNEAYIDKMIKAYARDKDLEDPYISPLFGDFTGFPPTYIQVGSNEILLSDSIRLKENMRGAGVSVKLDVFEGMWHVFQMAPFKTAYDAMDRNVAFIIEDLMHF